MDFYEILQVESSASGAEIKKAYYKLALQYHPDKASDEDREFHEVKFKEISQAYEVLSDEASRLQYDLYGSEGPQYDPSGFSGNPFDSYFNGQEEYESSDFRNFFHNMGGQGGPHARKPAQARTDDAELAIEVTLEDIFVGKTIRITSTRLIICKLCHGLGARKKAVSKTCITCEGQGVVRKINRIAPGVATQAYVPCTACDATGKVYRAKDKCKKCNGQKVTDETKILEFEILPGAESDGTIVLQGESDQYPGKVTGDVRLNYTLKEHAAFTRRGGDLYAKYKITLLDALCGFCKTVVMLLDSRAIQVKTPPGKVVRPGDYIKIKGEGMPLSKKTGISSWFSGLGASFGDLYIEMEIEFPRDNWYLEKNDIVKMGNLLPDRLQNEADASRQNIDTNAIPEANIELITDFSVLRQEALPQYPEKEPEKPQEKEHNPYDDAYLHDYGNGQPECHQQ